MGVFTEHHLPNGEIEKYASTNQWMRFAIDRMEATYKFHFGATTHPSNPDSFKGFVARLAGGGMDNWLPIELKTLRYEPAEKIMWAWVRELLFHQRGDGLVPTFFTPGPMLDWGVPERINKSMAISIGRMSDILEWFESGNSNLLYDSDPRDGVLLRRLEDWASAFVQAHGRQGKSPSWSLYDFVESGPLPHGLKGLLERVREGSSVEEGVGEITALLGLMVRQYECLRAVPDTPFLRQLVVDLKDTTEPRLSLREALQRLYREIEENSLAWLSDEIASDHLTIAEGQARVSELRRWRQSADYQNLPDSIWVDVTAYASVARSFEMLFKALLPDGTVESLGRVGDVVRRREIAAYAEFSGQINKGLWQARLNHDTYLMPSFVTSYGVCPSEREPVPSLSYRHDTDCLYWARGIFDAYRTAARAGARDVVRPELRLTEADVRYIVECISDRRASFGPSGSPEAEARAAHFCEIEARKSRLTELASGTATGADGEHPNADEYLHMAMGLTLDWIRGSWDATHNQFVRKVRHDGTAYLWKIDGASEERAAMGGDGKWNTLYVLVEAYRCTGDSFYLDLFMKAWTTFESASKAESLSGELGSPGLFPYYLVDGELRQGAACTPYGTPRGTGPRYCYSPVQEAFLDTIVRAYEASFELGAPRADILAAAEGLAGRIVAAYEAGIPDVVEADFLVVRAYVALAMARQTLRRVEFVSSDPGSMLVVESTVSPMLEIEVPERLAVIYMDDGAYRVWLRRKVEPEGTIVESEPVSIVVSRDERFDV